MKELRNIIKKYDELISELAVFKSSPEGQKNSEIDDIIVNASSDQMYFTVLLGLVEEVAMKNAFGLEVKA